METETLAKLTDSAVWQHKHVLDVDDFSSAEIEMLMQTAAGMKEVLSRPIRKTPALRGKTVFTIFWEASTRTRGSFELAAKNLSADVVNFTAQASSITKGESLIDTLNTVEALGADVIIMRHPMSGAPYHVLPYIKANLINAGDGWHAHPTQALLDLFTIRQHKGDDIKGIKIAIIGDIKHSRVAHSNIWSLTKMGALVTLCGPSILLPDISSGESRIFPPVDVTNDINEALTGADVVMALRLQKERMQSGVLPSLREFISDYQLDEARLRLAKPQALVMHPGPMNEDIEITRSVSHGPQSIILEQVSSGVAVRMALLYLMSGSKEL
jgi:aspartate carbamoyltransferase catalytic subunit